MTTDRCERTDLLVDQCGCRDHRGGQTPTEEAQERRPPGPWFVGHYDGTCSRCESTFRAGDTIRADGAGGWECCDA